MSQQQSPARKGSLLRTVKAVAWSFIGIRKNSDYQEDTAKLNIFHIIAVGLAGAMLFVLALVALVNWVVR
ncbi:DUF2970 domain-containing protein [Curvibacter sp. HBC61]|uniref:DUF2970 domain-containing protein n=1 Tax=Curvibacter cyanobacteriorum TaxID=3026422 RepID=A0ABT5N0N7_9BURK|nr:DUF2970 domain-containing protein [Curvibacter sp. HBC61]MDD0839690.1 DUF2970 domain-containing protein [Curvibacter sp. HBC61]